MAQTIAFANNTTRAGACFAAACAAAGVGGDARAHHHDAERQLATGSLRLEFQTDQAFAAETDAGKRDLSFNTTELALDLNLPSRLRIHTDVTVEPVEDVVGDLVFDNHGLYFETLHLALDLDQVTLWAGKGNPAFGIGWDPAITPGLYGVDFPEDYEITERIGFGASYALPNNPIGAQTLSAALFFADTSVLSRSYFTNRGQASLNDGGASNIEDPTSFSVALDGADPAFLPGLTYHVGFRRQEAGLGDAGDEVGAIAGAQKTFSLGETELALSSEVAFFKHLDGGANDALYGSFALRALRNDWFADAGASLRSFSNGPVESNFDDYQFRFGAGRMITDRLSLEATYRLLNASRETSHTAGLFLIYATDFGFF